MKRTALKSKPRRRPGRSLRFHSGQTECQHPSCPRTEPQLANHHVTYEQEVRRRHGDAQDPRNALTLCAYCHANHHSGARRVPLSALRDENYTFARDLMGTAAYDYLQARYWGADRRLEALLDTQLDTQLTLGEVA